MAKSSALTFRFNQASLRQCLGNMVKVRRTVIGNMPIMEAAADVLKQETEKTLSLTDHSLGDLARLDHPYARRHGSIQIHGGRSLVHERSGDMKRSLGINRTASGVQVGFDVSIAEEARYVVEGTRRMLPRDPIGETAADAEVQRRMTAAAGKRTEKALKAAK